MSITLNTRIQMVSNQSSSVLGDETILLNYELGNYYELNEVGGFIWSLLQERKSMLAHEILDCLLDEFDVEPSVGKDELMLFLDNLSREKLIETSV
ncbi:PqqD family peptide modification chaperone [Spirosoma pollinicola]|uniref:PqqD family protein n=1 Tax=Spirosoma pollinicola TaxID=2057025 RepID=A0A2K8YXY2_9BACT|nr:PqqD family peptide modification chaperone [Spirosoma pollinicola]AUD02483.1 PqqD family protein [Spirosoma pollinicola]